MTPQVLVVGFLLLPMAMALAILLCAAGSLLSDRWRCTHPKGDLLGFRRFDARSVADEAHAWLSQQS